MSEFDILNVKLEAVDDKLDRHIDHTSMLMDRFTAAQAEQTDEVRKAVISLDNIGQQLNKQGEMIQRNNSFRDKIWGGIALISFTGGAFALAINFQPFINLF